MNVFAVIGSFIMTMAFLAYGVGSITLSRFRIISSVVLIFYTIGLFFEISAMVLMIESSFTGSVSWHSSVGMVAFAIMLANTVMVWSLYIRKGLDTPVKTWLIHYTRTAYFLWVVAYLFGISLVIWF